MPKTPIDLGRSMPEGPCCVSSPTEKYYPSIHLDWEKDYEFPESGEMTVKFKRVHSNVNTNREGKTSYSVSLEFTEISDVSADKESKESKEKSTGEILDEYIEKE